MNKRRLEELIEILGRRPKLLIVDDVPSIILQVRTLFQDKCEVFMSTDGETAIELAQTIEPDVILLDINMPGMNGYSVCKHLELNPKTSEIPIIFLTGDSQDLSEELAFEMGAVDFIRKPLNLKVSSARTYTHLVNKLQSDLLKLASKQDGLTGLLNRAGLDEAFKRAWLECVRKKQSISILMIDIDYFKSYNDYFGHLAGDDCLKRISKAIANEAKKPLDSVARFGGEEFCCILPETDLKGALHFAKNIEESIRELKIPHPMSKVACEYVTVSIGVASHIPGPTHELNDMLNYADQLLYQSKETGRNTISSGELDAT